MDNGQPLSEEEFWSIYRRVPRLTVELVLIDGDGRVLLTKRATPPCRGLWHLPGGTVRFSDPVVDAVARVARTELDVSTGAVDFLGFIEYPSHYRNGLDHPVGLAFRVLQWSGEVTTSDAASAQGWFLQMPQPMHDEQREFLQSCCAFDVDVTTAKGVVGDDDAARHRDHDGLGYRCSRMPPRERMPE